MPSVSKKQHNLMALVANDPKAAKRLGISQSVGQEFMKADKGKTFKKGGDMKESKTMMKKEVAFMKKKGAPKSMIKHEEEEMDYCYGGKVKKMAMGGPAGPAAGPAQMDPRAMAMMAAKRRGRRPGVPPAVGMAPAPAAPVMAPGPAPTMKSGGRIASKGEHSVQKKSKRGAEMVKMASGGYVKAADGVAQRGKTKGKMVAMAGGGKAKRYC